MDSSSAFSRENNYIPLIIARKLTILQFLTPREIILLNIIKSCGTVAGFQLDNLWPCNGRKQLKKLAARGIIVRHRLDGQRKLNAYSLNTRLELDRALRQMAFAQLYLRIREVAVCVGQLTGVLKFNGRLFPLVVLRKGDRVPVLTNLPRLIVVAEDRDEILRDVDYRLTTDMDLPCSPMERDDLDRGSPSQRAGVD